MSRSCLAIDPPAPGFQPRRLLVAGTSADGKPSRDVFTHGTDDFPPQLAPLTQELTKAQRECPWEM